MSLPQTPYQARASLFAGGNFVFWLPYWPGGRSGTSDISVAILDGWKLEDLGRGGKRSLSPSACPLLCHSSQLFHLSTMAAKTHNLIPPASRLGEGQMPTSQVILPTTQNHFDWAACFFAGIKHITF